MTQEISSKRFRRERKVRDHGLIAETLFGVRRYLSRMSAADAAAVLLVWGNIIGLIAYPVFAGSGAADKPHAQAAVARQLTSQR